MQHHPQATTSSAQSDTPATGGSRWLLVAISLCGALAGGSIVEALAALASRTSAPVSPDHLIAAPLALAGAICGGLLAAVLVSKDHRAEYGHADTMTDMLVSAEIMPAEPMMWQPAAPMISCAQPSVSAATQTSRAALRARRIRRAIRQHGNSHQTIHAALIRPATRRGTAPL